MDDNSIQKTWERPWSTEEMRAHCSSWNLAGDAGLLKHLQEFSQNLMQKTHTTEVALDSLLEEMRNTSVDVQNASNALLMLSNNQFVENRVYDDCEEEKDEMEAKPEEKSVDVGEAALIAKAAETILLGMSVIDTKFDCMEVPASDSEGEEDLESPGRDKKSFALVLEPRNPYTARPLPYLIGSREFMEDDKIGLGDEEEEEEEEEEEDEEMHVSMGQDLTTQGLANDSGSSLAADIAEEGLFDEDELDDRRMPKGPSKQHWESSSSSASDDVEVENNRIRKKHKKNEPYVGSREHIDPFGRDVDEDDIFGKDSPLEDEFFGGSHIADAEPPAPVKKQSTQKGFAEELAAKLGAVESKKVDSEPVKPKKNKVENRTAPKAKSKTPSTSSDYLFGPPKDEWNVDDDADSIFADTDGMFSSDRGLFDDLNDPLLDAKSSKLISSAVPPSLLDRPPPLKKEMDPSLFGRNDGNIFGDEDEDDGDMFADISIKRKPPERMKKSEEKVVPEEAPRKKSSVISNNVAPVSPEIESKGKNTMDSSDSWLFDDDDDKEDQLYKATDIPKETSKKQVKEIKEGRKDDLLRDTTQHEEKEDVVSKKKLPAGARSLYAKGVDPFALGKKVVKEVQEKKKGVVDNQGDENDLFSAAKAASKKVAPKAIPKPVKSELAEKESEREQKHFPKPNSFFDGLGDGDDLFAPVSSKAPKAKNFLSTDSDELFGDDLFAPKKPAAAALDKSGEREKSSNAKKGVLSSGDVNSKGLFRDSGSEDDDIFSCSSSLGSRSSGSKVIPSKTAKPFSDPSNLLFGNEHGQDADIFSGTLGKTSVFEKKDVDDLFTDVGEDDDQNALNEKKEVIVTEKRDIKASLADSVKVKEDDLFSGADKLAPRDQKIRNVSEDLFSEVVTVKPSEPKIRSISEDLFAPDGEAGVGLPSSKKVKSALPKKTNVTSDDFQDEGDIFSSSLKKEGGIDDIFGEFDYKLDFDVSKKVANIPEKISGTDLVAEVDRKDIVSGHQQDKRKVSDSLFGDLRENDGEDIFSNKKPSKDTSVQESVTPSLTVKKPKPSIRKMHSNDLFADFSKDNEDLIFPVPKGKEEKKIDHLFSDPLSKEDDLFSSQKPKAASKTTLMPASKLSPDLFPVQDGNETGENLVKDDVKVESKKEMKKTAILSVVDDKKFNVQSAGLAANSRISPPRTLNLGKVIPSPKLGHNATEMGDDFFEPNDLDEDRIVQAWMKGHPPPLRDSKVENTMEDVPSYQDSCKAAKTTDVYADDNFCFGDIPSGALLHSHGKERARIQNRRRPPSRKVRKTPTTVPYTDKPIEEEQVVSYEPPSTATPASKGSIEEDRGSQETVEEWSTPEAALTSPPSVPPRSNPLSPSTDEEQDFFDVLPVGRYPPPMGPPELSPFSDALNPTARDGVGDDLWDKEDSGLFEDAGDKMGQRGYDSLWASSTSGVPPGIGGPFRDESVPSDDLFSDVSKKKASKESVGNAAIETVATTGKTDGEDLFADVGERSSEEVAAKEKETVSKEAGGGAVKKEEKAANKKEGKNISSKKGEMDDLWGEGFTSGSKLKDDLFSKGTESSGTGDFDDLFQGKGDLFGSSKTSSLQATGKVNSVGIAGSKSIGKSLSKLPPKTKDSLFDDDDDDAEDLFSPRPSKPAPSKASGATKKVTAGKSLKEQKPKSTSLTVTAPKGGSNDDSLFEDPLMVLKRKD